MWGWWRTVFFLKSIHIFQDGLDFAVFLLLLLLNISDISVKKASLSIWRYIFLAKMSHFTAHREFVRPLLKIILNDLHSGLSIAGL